MATSLSDLDRYLQGLPLNDEHAALMEGREPVTENLATVAANKTLNQGPLSTDDWEWLLRMAHEPGFPVFLRWLNSAIQKREDTAKLLSSMDPLSNQQAIINEWTYIACFRQIMQMIEGLPSIERQGT
jgi:hypothetical protein